MLKTAKEISQLLAARALDVAQHLYPHGKREGNEWCVGNVEGDQGKSLKIRVEGSKSGLWADFASGGSGDLLDLWSSRHGLDFGSTVKEALSFLGIAAPKFEPQRQKTFTLAKKQNMPVVVPQSPVMAYLTNERKLTRETIEKFRISQQNTLIVFPYIREGKVVFVKYLDLHRDDGKKVVFAEKDCEPCLFGWHLVPSNARQITICEGEIDAMTLHQYGITALSVPYGAGSGKKLSWIEHEHERLALFDEILLCFDNDHEGQKCIPELAERLGSHRCAIVHLPEKDANECLKKGISKQTIMACFQNADTLDPAELKRPKSLQDKINAKFYPPGGKEIGYQAPWTKSAAKVLFRPSELNIWTGINGHGKSQFLGHVLLGMMKQAAKVCIASLELKPEMFCMRLIRQTTALALPSLEYIAAVLQWYNDKLWVFDLLGTAKSKRLLEVFTYARQRYGVDVFVIDSMMKLDIAEDDYKAQKSFIEQVCDFKNQYNCQVHIVSHPRKGADESSSPGKLDMKGTGAISDLADNCFSIWRNKEKERCLHKRSEGYFLTEKELEKIKMPDCFWKCDKQRNGDWEGTLSFWYDKQSFQYLEHESHRPSRFVDYSCVGENKSVIFI
jgi:twinkle protein